MRNRCATICFIAAVLVTAKAASPSTIFSGKIALLALDIFKSLSLVDKIGIGGIIDTFNGNKS